ncbi:MAG: DUF4386 family protein [Caldilineaceae bacterium]
MNAKPTASKVTIDSDLAWRSLYRVGGVSGLLFVVLNLIAIVLDLTTPPPVSGGVATLEFIAAHRVSYSVEQVLWLAPGLFAALVFLALYPALKPLNQSYAALGAFIGAAAWALTLVIPTTTRGAPALVFLSDQYAATTDAAQRAIFATAAEALIAQNNTPNIVGVLTPVGILLLGLVMRKGIFPKPVAYLSIVTGALGIVSEALRFALPAAYTVYGLFLLSWFGVIGWKLYQLDATYAGQSIPQGTRL